MAVTAISKLRTAGLLSPHLVTGELANAKNVLKEAPEDPLSKFPAHLNSKLCWTSESFTPLEYVVQLTAEDVAAILSAISSFKALNLPDIALVCSDDFPLPRELVEKLRGPSNEIHSGRGFAVLRGLALDDQPFEDGVIALCGLASYIGQERSTNDNGISMDHLRDAVKDDKPAGREHVELNPAKMMAPLKFHADRKFADVLALYVKSKAAIGGEQYLSSAWQAYNDMMVSCPDALRVLAGDFPWPGVVNDLPQISHTPVIFQRDGRVFFQVVHRVFEGTNLLRPEQETALDLLETFANKHAIKLDVQVGDIQFVNNLALLHARRAWVDRPGQERHYYRLGLRDAQNFWKRPLKYEAVFDDHLGKAPEEQSIPVTDFDPYGMTSFADMGHG